MDAIFVMLAQNDYQMLEFEASSFIPYLVQKVSEFENYVLRSVESNSAYNTSLLFFSLKTFCDYFH